MKSLSELTLETFRENEDYYRELLKAPENWRQVPSLNYETLHELPDFSLVCFRGMIQDMLDPEIYLERYIVNSGDSTRVQDGKFRDILCLGTSETLDYDSTENIHGERRTMFVVSIPGINSWASEYERSLPRVANNPKESLNSSVEASQKRTIDESQEIEDMDVDCPANAGQKRVKTSNEESNSNCNLLSMEYLLNSPLADRPSKACMVKIYSDFDEHLLNTTIDVIGFLSVHPALDGSTTQPSEFEDITEIQATNPPPSLIPRLHAIHVRKLNHFNPLLDQSLAEVDPNVRNMETVQKDLRIVLTQCLFGDTVAADYLLSHLISAVYVRTDLQTLGQFSINISNIPAETFPEYTKELYSIIEAILPASHYFPMTLVNMNNLQFILKKDYKTNKLTSGLLQLAPHTHLVVDETQLQSGKLESSGILATQSLANLIKNQQIRCNFEYYDLDFNVDIPVLILSEGRSLLPSNAQIPLHIDPECAKLIPETLKAAKHYLQPKLNTIRKYLTLLKIRDFSMNPDDTEMVQKDFVEMRKTNSKFGADDLHSLLVLSRLLGLASGKLLLDKEIWNRAKEMEVERRKRIEALVTRK